jgi:hypothetical protein
MPERVVGMAQEKAAPKQAKDLASKDGSLNQETFYEF